MKNSLAIAIEALSWMAYEGVGERTALFRASNQLGSTHDELRQAHRIIMETTRFRNRIEHLTSGLLPNSSLEHIPHGVQSFLTILVYLKQIDQTETRKLQRVVSLGRQILGWKELHPYEEAIGRILTKQSEIRPQDEYERVALETCHPVWYARRVMLVFGRDVGLHILRRNLTNVPLYVRANPLRAPSGLGQQKFKDAVEVAGIQKVWRLDHLKTLSQQQGTVAAGEIVIQDLSAIVADLVACPVAGNIVLDVCSAPGNKTSHCAALMGNEGRILSVDVSSERMMQWKHEMIRTGCLIAEPIIADARRLEVNVEADLVIVDPPCSNSGVFAKNPSMKWRTTPSRLDSLTIRQFTILQSSARHVKSGGSLIYCTCSILPEENEDVLLDFLHRNPDFHLKRQQPFLGSPGLKGFDLCQRFYTHLHDCNGYFIAKLRRD
ncbi:MAG TPA: RsmB/NOP family class I SAM-dependent RNA methyltransferase [Candidatus Bathyarchaeia archaeon]|nr:RsmB/NOP family class I SAM-dependent RNA methyltransferase [Candidatus Bathyarchaeia archaeon]